MHVGVDSDWLVPVRNSEVLCVGGRDGYRVLYVEMKADHELTTSRWCDMGPITFNS